jgi:tRNA-dihydrouridine synthase B
MKSRSEKHIGNDNPHGLLKCIKLKKTRLPGNLFLAPLAGYTDGAFRSVCFEQGADFAYTEMVSAEALARGSSKTVNLLKPWPTENMLGVQVFGSDYTVFLKALPLILTFNPTLIDINCGCSIPKVLKTGSGAALLRFPQKIRDIIKALSEACTVPVTLKIRSGWDAAERNYREVADAAVEAGASLITLHPRTQAQRFTGTADWSQLKQLKTSCPLPVIGSGDLFSAEDALRMMSSTGCDGVMFARGALGNPFIFRQARQLLGGSGAPDVIPDAEKLAVFLTQLKRLALLKGEPAACREMRKQLAAYTRGMRNARPLREAGNKAESISRYQSCIRAYLENI